MHPFRRVLVPIDFSEHTKRVLQVAAEQCRRYQAQITLLHVRQPESLAAFSSSGRDERGATPTQLIDLLIEANRDLQADGALEVHIAITDGKPGTGIVRFAKERGFDLIVMGTHSRRGLSHALFGSVADEVLQRAPCAVMTVQLGGPTSEKGERMQPRPSAGPRLAPDN